MLDRILIGSSSEPTDANFKNVTLLLHGDGSNGAQNNTFIDSSTNNFTITRNGNTTQGSFSPYGSNWSNYFDGSSDASMDYLLVSSTTALGFGTGDFTIELWFFTPAFGAIQTLIDLRSSATAQPLTLSINSSGLARSYDSTTRTGGQCNAGQWNHIAWVRASGVNTVYVNGAVGHTWTNGADYGSSRPAWIGNELNAPGSYPFKGYISNLRAVKGTAVYTSAFTPPTAPLTAITNTSLLTCADNRFRDGSTNNFTITRNGDVKVTNFAPFAPSSAYSTTTNGGSAYFDGSGDYLTVPDGTWSQLSSGSFTIEMWAYPNSLGGYQTLISKRSATWELGFDPSNKLYWYNGTVYPTTAAVTNGQWVHVAATWDGTNLRLFINGILDTTISGANAGSGSGITYIGAFSNQAFNGCISNLRVLKGTALYTANFTPPASPVTAITNTQLLLNATNAAIFDNSMKNDLETVGNAQISTSVKKFGTGSIYFDGSGDNLFSPSIPDMDFGSGNWTIEMWVYVSTRTTNYPLLFGNNRGGFTTDALALTASNSDSGGIYADKFVIAWGSSGWSSPSTGNSALLVSNATNSTGTWYHLAIVRNGTSVKMYRNGTEVASATVSSTATFNWGYNGTLMGGGNWDGAAGNFNGYLDEVRATKGVARYTANFTAPTAPFPNK